MGFKNILYVIESHEQLLQIWRDQNLRNLRVLHLDFHCDMRGLLVDRPNQRARYIARRQKELDEGNFLTHAILEKRIITIQWIHDLPGGRQDDIGTVKYESDLSVHFTCFHLKIKKENWMPLRFEESLFSEWKGLESDLFLDIDWDFFACKKYPFDSIKRRVEAFLNLEFNYLPKKTSLCYSPNYSHETRNEFNCFVSNIAEKLQAKIVRIPRELQNSVSIPKYKKVIPPPAYTLLRKVYHQSSFWLQKKGVY